ncbi:MAG: hypothetical protein ACYCW6_09280 [Candidatus Xenobia bacterium]
MGQARNTINDSLNQGFVHMGVTEPATRDDRPRQITMAQLEQYGRDAQALDAISARAQAQGLPRFTFPRGMGVADLQAIMNGTIPPHGRMAPRGD